MGLQYSFREAFKGKKLRPKRLWKILTDLDSRVGTAETTLANAVDNDTIYDDSDLKAKMGYNNIPANTNLQEEIDAKADASSLNSKANANHNHTLDKITDCETVEVVVTYTDESTETLYLVKQIQTP